MGDGVDPIAAIPDFRSEIVGNGDELVLLSRYMDPARLGLDPVGHTASTRRPTAACSPSRADLPFSDATYAFRGFRPRLRARV